MEDHYADSAFRGKSRKQYYEQLNIWAHLLVQLACHQMNALDAERVVLVLNEAIDWHELARDSSFRRAWSVRSLAHLVCEALGID